MVRRVPTARAGAALLVALSLVLAAAPAAVLGVAPSDGGVLVLVPVTINASAGDQFDPHVSGDISAYTDGVTIRYYNFSLGSDDRIPELLGATDSLSGVSDGRIVFSRFESSGRAPILVFDVATTTTTEVDPQSFPARTSASIGSDTVAFIDQDMAAGGELVASVLAGATNRVTTDTRLDRRPSVAPLGDLIVYESCQSSALNCDIRQAGWNGSTWTITNLTTNSDPESNPDTDGVVVVYDSTRGGERDIYSQSVGGGTELILSLAGEQRNPSVNAGVVAFESAQGDGAADLFVYEIASSRLFRVTNTAGVNETLNDVTVLPDGRVRVVWASGVPGSRDVFGATFELPPVEPPTYAFGGFLQPVDPLPTLNALKAGAAVPVKFSLGGDRGLDIFATGYPKSETIGCDSTAAVDGVEQTLSAGGSSLTYDPIADVYTYVWKTDKAWSGTCRQLVFGLADGTFQRANFKLR